MNAFALCLCLSMAAPRSDDRWLAEDKWKHFFASFVVTSLAASGARAAGLEPDASLVVGAAVGTGAGIWKEWRDLHSLEGTVSGRDLVWDVAGVGAALVVARQAR